MKGNRGGAILRRHKMVMEARTNLSKGVLPEYSHQAVGNWGKYC